jgi:hypothetical protein
MIFAERRKTGQVDLEATEMAVRSGMQHAGAAALTQLLQFPSPEPDQRRLNCGCGGQALYRGLRSKPVLTVLGPAEVSRPYYWCAKCQAGQFPADDQLDIDNTSFSPGVRRMQAMVGQLLPFDQGHQQLKLLAGLDVTAKAVERVAEAIGQDIATGQQQEMQRAVQLDLPVVIGKPIPILYIEMDGTSVHTVKKETVGRQGKDGKQARGRDVKLGCVFTQTTWDEKGYAIRDPDTTSYVGAIETSEEFGKRIYVEAYNRGWSRASKKVVMGDGAEWIWNLADEYFPGAIQIVDLYHARQHLWELVRKLYPNDEAERNRWMTIHQDLLDQCKLKKLIASLESIETSSEEFSEMIQRAVGYFTRNARRMRYPKFRRQHLFVGTGVIEAGCKTMIGSRLKQSGMFWTVRGANAILALRCCHFNGRFESYWEERVANC